MLMDILVEALTNMDYDTLEHVLESCSEEELAFVDEVMEATKFDENGNPIVIPIDEYAQDIVDKNFEENYEKGYYATGVLIIPEEENEKDDTSDTTQNG